MGPSLTSTIGVVRDILSDLVAEQQALDQFLQRAPIRDWSVKARNSTTVKDLVAHLASDEELARDSLDGGGAMLDRAITEGPDPVLAERATRANAMRPQDVIEWWRGSQGEGRRGALPHGG